MNWIENPIAKSDIPEIPYFVITKNGHYFYSALARLISLKITMEIIPVP